MNRRELVQAVATHTDSDKKQVDRIVAGLTDVVTSVVSKGEPVTISGFAKFAKAERAARMGRNPATGEAIKIKASKKARITPLKGFKDAVIKPSDAPKLAKGVWPPAPVAPAAKTATKTAAKTTTRAAAATAGRGAAKSATRSTATRSTATKAATKPAGRTTTKATAKPAARKTATKTTTTRKTAAKASR